MKKSTIVGVLILFYLAGSGAQSEGIGGGSDNSVYMGYLIKLLPAGSNGFGYEIFFRSRMVVYQSNNPFTLAPTGLRNREDALKIAKWQVEQIWHEKARGIIKNRLLSRKIAKQLKISVN
jgi:hypothetical protein